MVRQNFVGTVISQGKMNKTIKVRVQRVKFNKLVNKNVIRFTDFLVHDEVNKCNEGDVVRIQYVRPLSARKSFAVTEILTNKGLSWLKYREEAPKIVAKEELEKILKYKEETKKRTGTDENGRQFNVITAQLDEQRKKLLSSADSLRPKEIPILELDISAMRKKLEELNLDITNSSFSATAKDLVKNNPKKADQILTEMGKADPSQLSNNVKKNLLMKYFVKNVSKDKLKSDSEASA